MTDQYHLPSPRYVAALRRFRERIVKGDDLIMENSESHGNKFTECSWGLCCEEPEMWPRKDWMWPDKEPIQVYRRARKDGKALEGGERTERVTLRDLSPGDLCPFDRGSDGGSSWGCFYRCHVFSPEGEKLPDRERALELYDIRIEAAR